jgi:hypothetical protein
LRSCQIGAAVVHRVAQLRALGERKHDHERALLAHRHRLVVEQPRDHRAVLDQLIDRMSTR